MWARGVNTISPHPRLPPFPSPSPTSPTFPYLCPLYPPPFSFPFKPSFLHIFIDSPLPCPSTGQRRGRPPLTKPKSAAAPPGPPAASWSRARPTAHHPPTIHSFRRAAVSALAAASTFIALTIAAPEPCPRISDQFETAAATGRFIITTAVFVTSGIVTSSWTLR